MNRFGRLFVATLIGCLLAGFFPALAQTPAISLADRTAIAKLRDEAGSLVREQMELSWKRRTTGEKTDLAATYNGHEKLFSIDSLLLLMRAEAAATNPDEKKAYGFFRDYLLGEMVGMRVAGLNDEIDAYLAGARFDYSGKNYAYYELPRLLRDEKDYAARQELSNAVAPILREANERYRRKEQRLQRLAKELGFADYLALAAQLRHVDLTAFAATCKQFLDDSQKGFVKLQNWAVPFQLGFPADKLRRCDTMRLFGAERFAAYFGKDELLPRWRSFLGGLGLPADKIKVDDADRPRKSPRAMCYPVAVPGDVRLTLIPAAGFAEYQALWHETGHAQQAANTTAGLWEFQQLGDHAATDAFAFLFDGLFADPGFLRRAFNFKEEDATAFGRFVAYQRLYQLRRYCAKVLYEMVLHRGLEEPLKAYRGWHGQAAAIALDENDGLRCYADADDFLAGADYVRAWLLEATLAADLARRYGEDWYAQPAAGAYLRSWWSKGRYYRAAELAAQAGRKQIEPQDYFRRLKPLVKGKY
ncbi:MAG: hypothetical protein GX444_04120 [Myxococcales bacterium]|nr:hypothetical protein [Myxococcales bacterium]